MVRNSYFSVDMHICRYVAVLCFLATLSHAQDISNFNQFFLNPYTINASYAGIEGRPAFFVAYRKQWTTIQGAPVIGNFSFHTPLKKNLSFGMNVTSDKRGIINTSSILFSIAYTVPVDNTSFFRFGLSAGYGYNSVDWEKVGTFNDPALSNLLNNNSFLAGNAGASYHKKTFHIGLALPNIFAPIYLSNEQFSVTALKPFQSVVLHASNRFYFNKDKNVFEPYLIYRLNNGLPSQLEAAAVVHLQHVVWVGGSYKQQFGTSALLGFKLQNIFAVGFSYSIKNSGANQLSSPSYEIQLAYLGGKKKKEVSAYSFVDTHKEKGPRKKTPAELAAERKKQNDQKIAEDKKKKEAIDKQIADQNKKVLLAARADSTRKAQQKKAIADSIAHQQHLEEQERLARIETHAANPNEEHGDSLNAHPHADRHEFVKRDSGNPNDLAVGNYVVVGVFGSQQNAENFAKGLNRMAFNAKFGFLTLKNYWYVYLFKSDDINEVRTERNKQRKLKLFRDAWLLTVEE